MDHGIAEIVLLLVGLTGLWQGTRITVKKAIELANAAHLSQAFVGLAIVAVGTDLPETVVSINTSIHRLGGEDTSALLLGNAVGSCMCQITLILGLSGLFAPQSLERKSAFNDGGVLIGSIVLLFAVGLTGIISRLEGSLLIVAYISYYVFMLRRERTPRNDGRSGPPSKLSRVDRVKIVLALLLGLGLVIVASEIVVMNALSLSERLGVRQSFVGIIIVGLGTSLPELSVSLAAALRKSQGIAVGNILGSNIYDTLIPPGIGAAISPLRVSDKFNFVDLSILLVVSLIILVMLQTKKGLQRKESVSLIFMYLVYASWKWSSV